MFWKCGATCSVPQEHRIKDLMSSPNKMTKGSQSQKEIFSWYLINNFEAKNGFVLGAEIVPLETETGCLALMKEKKLNMLEKRR